jgi:Protein of unknown function (DUF2510)
MPEPPRVPPGWYPDPNGQRQWRVWTGSMWSTTTRPFDVAGESATTRVAEALAAHRLERYGVGGVCAGLGLAVSVAAHWPGTAHPMNATAATALMSLAIALLAVGTASYALCGRDLLGRWVWPLVVPGVNVAAVSSLVARRLGDPGPGRRALIDVVAATTYVLLYRDYPVLALVPALVAADLALSLSRLDLGGAAPPAP